jgi:hypothetical protein
MEIIDEHDVGAGLIDLRIKHGAAVREMDMPSWHLRPLGVFSDFRHLRNLRHVRDWSVPEALNSLTKNSEETTNHLTWA